MTREAATLNTDPNIASPDEFYAALIEAHRGLCRSRARCSTPS